jgi:hypothetical protein
MAYERNPRKRVVRGASEDELRQAGRRRSEELQPSKFDMPFVRLGSSAIGTGQDVVQRIGDAIIGGDFGGNARGEGAIDIQITRDEGENGEVASGAGAIAFGLANTAAGAGSVAIGIGNIADEQYAVALGVGAGALGEHSLSLGYGAYNNQPRSLALGRFSDVQLGATDGVAVGTRASSRAPSGVAVGVDTSVTGDNGIAIGNNAQASGLQTVAFGLNVDVSGDRSVGIGAYSTVSGDNSVGVGTASVTGINSTGIGVDVFAWGSDSTVIGQGSATGDQSLAVGVGDVLASGGSSVALGESASAVGDRAVALGLNAYAGADQFVVRALAARMQIGSNPGDPANFESVITTADTPTAGNLAAWTDADGIEDSGIVSSSVATTNHGHNRYIAVGETMTLADKFSLLLIGYFQVDGSAILLGDAALGVY